MKALRVLIEGAVDPIGYLVADDNYSCQFAYSEAWLANRGAFPISQSVPLSQTEYGDVLTRAFSVAKLDTTVLIDAAGRIAYRSSTSLSADQLRTALKGL